MGIVFWGFGLVGFVLSKYGRKSMRKVGGGKRWEPSGPNKRREQEAGSGKKLARCRISGGAEKTIETQLFSCCAASTQNKTVYKHSFFVGRRRATRQKQCFYTLFSLRNKVVFIHCFFGSARNATLLKLAGALPHVLPPVPTCDSGGGIVCADRRRMWHDMAAKTQI